MQFKFPYLNTGHFHNQELMTFPFGLHRLTGMHVAPKLYPGHNVGLPKFCSLQNSIFSWNSKKIRSISSVWLCPCVRGLSWNHETSFLSPFLSQEVTQLCFFTCLHEYLFFKQLLEQQVQGKGRMTYNRQTCWKQKGFYLTYVCKGLVGNTTAASVEVILIWEG